MREQFDMYRDEVDALELSTEEKDRIADRIEAQLKAMEDQSELPAKRKDHGKSPSLLRWAAAFAGTCLLVGATSIAYATGDLELALGYLGDIFTGAPAQTELIEQVGCPIGASQTSGGVTITCEAIAGDRNNLVVIYTLEREDGTSLEEVATTNDESGKISLAFTGSTGIAVDGITAGGGGSYFYDSEPGDGKIQYVQQQHLELRGNEGIIGRTARVTLSDLRICEDGKTPLILASGTWSFKFKINYVDTTTELEVNEQTSYVGKAVEVETVMISPIAITVEYSGDEEWSSLKNLPIIVRYSDGDSLGSESFTVYAEERGDGAHLKKTVFLDRIGGASELRYIEVGDVVVKISE